MLRNASTLIVVIHITLHTGELKTLDKDKKYDVILANINRNVLLENVNRIAIRHRLGGTLLLSGILIRDKAKVTDIYEYHGYRVEHVNEMRRMALYRISEGVGVFGLT